jgi:hypothetical protein
MFEMAGGVENALDASTLVVARLCGSETFERSGVAADSLGTSDLIEAVGFASVD